jgi:CheY-like chemotaxis protein
MQERRKKNVHKKILVIDDDEGVRKSFGLALEDSGYPLKAVGSGSEGIEEVAKGGYGLIFLDLKMPVMNGVETLRSIRKIDQEVPVYIVTAFYKEFFGGLQEASKDGIMFELLEKPITGKQIQTVVQGVLEGGIDE